MGPKLLRGPSEPPLKTQGSGLGKAPSPPILSVQLEAIDREIARYRKYLLDGLSENSVRKYNLVPVESYTRHLDALQYKRHRLKESADG